METQANPSVIIAVTLFKSAILPVLTAGLVAWLLGKFWVGDAEGEPKGDIASAVGAALGFCAGYWALSGFNEFPPILVQHWSPYFALLSLILFSAAHRFGWAGFIPALLIALGTILYLNLAPLIKQWESGEAAQHLGVLAIAWALLWSIWRFALPKQTLPEIPLLGVVTLTAASLVNVMDGSASIGQSAGVMAAACGGIFLARFAVPALGVGLPFYSVVLTVFGAMLINGLYYVEVDRTAIILAACVPLAALIYLIPGVLQWSVWKRGGLLAAVALVPLIVAVILLATKPVEAPYY